MDERLNQLKEHIDLLQVVGYLNFSNGRPDSQFQKNWNQAQAFVAAVDTEHSWQTLSTWLMSQLPDVSKKGASAFADLNQARSALTLLHRLLPEYLAFHKDLLGHLTQREVGQPFFIVRALEAILSQGGPWHESDRIISGTLDRLNDFLGYRPIATLENNRLGEPYPHERFRPIPLYLRNALVGFGSYQQLIEEAINILKETPADILEDASFEISQLEEWAYDPRIYDHAHPANRRPNYVFGEWDPLQLDRKGEYRRYVTRQLTLDVLTQRVQAAGEDRKGEYLHEAGIVLAGTVLMAAAMTGRSPGIYDSSVKLSNLVPRIAKLRDRYYNHRFELLQGSHKARLKEEATRLRQPFGGARHHLNQAITQHRADQLQHRHVAYFLARLGSPADSIQRITARAPVSSKFGVILQSLLAGVNRSIDAGNLAAAVADLDHFEKNVLAGIECGALPDPWNALAFQAQFPTFQSMEDAVADHRLHELCDLMSRAFHLAGRVLGEAAASGQHDATKELKRNTKRLAAWWNKFATSEISDLPHVVGEELLHAALQVSEPLANWHDRGQTGADLVFWRSHLQRFRSASSFALVVDVLLHRRDYSAAQALLINWLSHASEVPLEDGERNYFDLMTRWTLEVLQDPDLEPTRRWTLLKRFLDLVEANADEYWDLSHIELETSATDSKLEDDNPYAAAYEGMAYKDSSDDGTRGSLADDEPRGPIHADFPLEHQAADIAERFRFLAHLSQLWRLIARQVQHLPQVPDFAESLDGWWKTAQQQRNRLLKLLLDIQACAVPEPLGSHASMVEFDRQRSIKDRTLEAGLHTALDLAMAERSLLAASHVAAQSEIQSGEADDWLRQAVQIENLMWRGEVEKIEPRLSAFAKSIRQLSLLYKPLDAGGLVSDMFETRLAQAILRDIIVSLPRLGLVRETYNLLKTVRDQERAQAVRGRVVTEFNRLFEMAMASVACSLSRSVSQWQPEPTPSRLVHLLDQLAKPFLMLWIDHSHSVRLSSLEAVQGEEWQQVCDFIQKFGSDLFHPRFMNLANLRAILNRGVKAYMDYLEEEAATARDEEQVTGAKLLSALSRNRYPRDQAVKHMEFVLRALVENYEEYKDYNATTTQSDYGENLYRLLAFLRLKCTYERHVWNIKPLVWIHDALAREGQEAAALLWQQTIARLTSEIARRHVEDLRALQQEHGMQLRTIADLIEERFVAPLDVGRLIALVEPAFKASNAAATQVPPPGSATQPLAKLLFALDIQLKKTTGSGLDVPSWIRLLEQEFEYAQSQQKLEKGLELPLLAIREDKIEAQLASWDMVNDNTGLLPG